MGVKSNAEEQSMNPGRVYPNGILPDWINPLYGLTWEPKGTMFPGPSDDRKTFAQPQWNYQEDRNRMRNGFSEDITGNPYTSNDPEWSEGMTDVAAFNERYRGGAVMGDLERRYKGYRATHNPGPESTADPKSLTGKMARGQEPGLDAQLQNQRYIKSKDIGKMAALVGATYVGYRAMKRRR